MGSLVFTVQTGVNYASAWLFRTDVGIVCSIYAVFTFPFWGNGSFGFWFSVFGSWDNEAGGGVPCSREGNAATHGELQACPTTDTKTKEDYLKDLSS